MVAFASSFVKIYFLEKKLQKPVVSPNNENGQAKVCVCTELHIRSFRNDKTYPITIINSHKFVWGEVGEIIKNR